MIIIQLQTYPAKTIFPKPVNQTEPNGTKQNQMEPFGTTGNHTIDKTNYKCL